MFFQYFLIPVCLVVAGCVTTANVGHSIAVEGAQVVIARSKVALVAYQSGNKDSWGKVVCSSPLSEWSIMRSLVGDIRNIRVLAIAGPSDAGNSTIDFQHPMIAYQVTSSRYALTELLLKFAIYDQRDCLNLSY